MFSKFNINSLENTRDKLVKVIENNKNKLKEYYNLYNENLTESNDYILDGTLYRFGKCFIVIDKFDYVPDYVQKRREISNNIKELKQKIIKTKAEIDLLTYAIVLKRRKIRFLLNDKTVKDYEKRLFKRVFDLALRESIEQ